MIKIGKSTSNISVYTCQPKSNEELVNTIKDRISKEGPNCDLNDIDVSLIRDMSYLFNFLKDFNGDISCWNVSNVKDMTGMFYDSKFNGDISNWDTRNVDNMSHMFWYSKFNKDISNWNVSNVKNTYCMFYRAKFNGDISKWNINKSCDTSYMFEDCTIKEEYKPKSLQNL